MIYIYSSFYNEHSNGISCMYELARILNNNHIDTKILCYENENYNFLLPEDLKKYYISKSAIPKSIGKDDIVIYPDVISGNPLNARNIIRWLMNKPSFLFNQEISFGDFDILLSYSNFVNPNLPQLFIIKNELKLFKSIRENFVHDKNTVSVYFGKVDLDVILSKEECLKKCLNKYKNVNIITRLFPNNREDTLSLIAQSDLLISFDGLTNLNYEATLLGTPVLYMDDPFDIEKTKFNINNGGICFDINDLKGARNNLRNVFKDYEKWLSIQETEALKVIVKQIKNINKINNNDASYKKNILINNNATQFFIDSFKKRKKQFTNIDFPQQIPLSTYTILCSYNNNVRVNKKNKNNNNNPILLKLKPKNIDEMYVKMPGNLTLRELFYLLLRRIVRKEG